MRTPTTQAETVRVYRCELPLSTPYQLSSVLGELTHAEPVVVEIETTDGHRGYGETDPFIPFTQDSARSVVALLDEFLGDALADVDVTNPNEVHNRLDAVYGPDNHLVKSAVDMACYDLLGKVTGRPASDFLGGRVHDEIDVLQPLGNVPADECARQTRALEAEGFSTFMLKTGYFSIDEDIARLRAIREATGDETDVIVDANQGWDVRTAVEFAERAVEYDVAFLEQPVPADDVDGLRRVREASPIPISADESLFSVRDARRLIEADAVDIFSIKVAKHGGLREAKHIVDMAEAFDVACYMNSMIETGFTQAASLQLGVSTNALVDVGHAYMSPLRLGETLTDFDQQITDGTVTPSDDPGLGVTPTRDLSSVAQEVCEIDL
ncbi:mandelate racemase/muconate lactonizing enzyme family protein [Haloferax sp. YSMS24]|uniref:mandelate racemase/muconate lactonizing enzyme family protein n=1 Tax=unclassified Haloferax TaxID=2625095 RepID=UPI00398D1953